MMTAAAASLPPAVMIWQINQGWHDNHLRAIPNDQRQLRIVRDTALRRWLARRPKVK